MIPHGRLHSSPAAVGRPTYAPGPQVRKLEFLLADAISQGCDCVVTIGARRPPRGAPPSRPRGGSLPPPDGLPVARDEHSGGIQSNHARSTALAARSLGLDSYLILRTSAAVVDKVREELSRFVFATSC